MAATHNVPHQLASPQISKHGVLTLSGFGIRVTMQSGHLEIEDSIGPDHRRLRLPRVGHGLKRLVIIGADGFVSLAALRWLADQQAAFVMLERDGRVLTVTGPVRPSDARLRRAQALAGQSETSLRIARELIDKKLAGQESVARQKLLATDTAERIVRHRAELAEADTPEKIRLVESLAAGAYWSAWRSLPVNFPRKDEARVPHHWRVFGARVSPLTGSPRLAVNPPNAILNYLYAVLESESRLAAAALGLDPGLGMLHVDAPARDSLACDLMEPVRPHIDTFVLNWITRETLKREWFFEQHNGNCRLMGTLVERLSETAPTWGRAVAPFAEWVAQSLWSSIRKPARSVQRVPTRLTQRRRTEGRGKEFVLDVKAATHPSNVCAGCGATTRVGRHCAQCGRGISRTKLIELAKVGRAVALNAGPQEKRSETQRGHAAAKRAWHSSAQPAWLNEGMYLEKIRPHLSAVTISALSSALGVSESYAADIRAGRRRPHPRHWQTLAQLVGISRERCEAPAPSAETLIHR
jgi:CRISPR-associated endonuclease Cas1